MNQGMMLREFNSDRTEEHRRSTRNSVYARSDNTQMLLDGTCNFLIAMVGFVNLNTLGDDAQRPIDLTAS